MSYSWVLERLRDIFGTVHVPDVIVTDRDEGLSTAILDIHPGKLLHIEMLMSIDLLIIYILILIFCIM